MSPIHHVFVCVRSPREHVDELVRRGLREGSGNVHRGQGTANARFFFDDSFLEILWETDADEIGSERVAPTRLADRCRGSASPFGVAVRGLSSDPAWQYRAPFLPSETSVSAGPALPMWSEPGSAGPLIFGAEGPAGQHDEPRRGISIARVELCGPYDAPQGLPPSAVFFRSATEERMRLHLHAPASPAIFLPDALRIDLVW